MVRSAMLLAALAHPADAASASSFLQKAPQEWNLLAGLKFFTSKTLGPVGQAVALTYQGTSGPELVHEDYGMAIIPEKHGSFWERLPLAEIDPSNGGIHVIAYTDRHTQRNIIAFRGLSMSPNVGDDNRDLDYCVDAQLKRQEPAADLHCERFRKEQFDYLGQAEEVIGRVKMLTPGYKILLTGHNLGGRLAILIAAKLGMGIKALGFGVGPMNFILQKNLHLSQAAIEDFPHDFYMTLENPCDPLYIQAQADEFSLAGLTVCTFQGLRQATGCRECVAAKGNLTNKHCKTSYNEAHRFRTYMDAIKTAQLQSNITFACNKDM